jgi:hypothetical protein
MANPPIQDLMVKGIIHAISSVLVQHFVRKINEAANALTVDNL